MKYISWQSALTEFSVYGSVTNFIAHYNSSTCIDAVFSEHIELAFGLPSIAIVLAYIFCYSQEYFLLECKFTRVERAVCALIQYDDLSHQGLPSGMLKLRLSAVAPHSTRLYEKITIQDTKAIVQSVEPIAESITYFLIVFCPGNSSRRKPSLKNHTALTAQTNGRNAIPI